MLNEILMQMNQASHDHVQHCSRVVIKGKNFQLCLHCYRVISPGLSYGDWEYYFIILQLCWCNVISSHLIMGCLCVLETTRLFLCLLMAL